MVTIDDWVNHYKQIENEQAPAVGYFETKIVEGICKKVLGGRSLFGRVSLEFSSSDILIFTDSLSKQKRTECETDDLLRAVFMGVLDVMLVRPLRPITKFRCNIVDIETHPIDSSWQAFRLAGRYATEEFLRNQKFVVI